MLDYCLGVLSLFFLYLYIDYKLNFKLLKISFKNSSLSTLNFFLILTIINYIYLSVYFIYKKTNKFVDPH